MLGHDSHLREFERFFGCPVEFRASSDWLEFSAQTLALPLVTEDQNLLEALKPVCDAALRERGTRKERSVPWSRTKCKEHCRTATFVNRA